MEMNHVITSSEWWKSKPTNVKWQLESFSKSGGLSGKVSRLIISYPNDSQTQTYYIIKTTNAAQDARQRSKELGLAREALFYKSHLLEGNLEHLDWNEIDQVLPEVVVSEGNMDTGEKTILMEDLAQKGYSQSGYFFGACNPHNWNKDLDSIVSQAMSRVEVKQSSNLTSLLHRQELTRQITLQAFTSIAKLHASYWNNRGALTHPKNHEWLRGSEWLTGQGQAEWLAHQRTAQTAWAQAKAKILAGNSNIQWTDHLIACMDASLSKVSWDEFQRGLLDFSKNITLIHGDFHPANVMWAPAASSTAPSASLKILDWEVVGVGSGPQDCAQFVISHMFPEERRACERDLMQAYHAQLVSFGVSSSSYTFEECFHDYIVGGTSRWVWLLAVLTQMVPAEWMQRFHDQVAAFIKDHNVTAENIEMPRV